MPIEFHRAVVGQLLDSRPMAARVPAYHWCAVAYVDSARPPPELAASEGPVLVVDEGDPRQRAMRSARLVELDCLAGILPCPLIPASTGSDPVVQMQRMGVGQPVYASAYPGSSAMAASNRRIASVTLPSVRWFQAKRPFRYRSYARRFPV
jgi:hypothetical protein